MDKPRNKGGRPNREMPKLLRDRLSYIGLKPTWDSLGAVFGFYTDNTTHSNNARKVIYESKLKSVEQFIVAAETLKMSPRELYDYIMFTRRVKDARQSVRVNKCK